MTSQFIQNTFRELQNMFACQYVASDWLKFIYSQTPWNSQTFKILIWIFLDSLSNSLYLAFLCKENSQLREKTDLSYVSLVFV